MNIPEEAVEAAVLAMDGASLCGCTDCQRVTALNIITAALPAIEKEIRAQVAAELRGELPVQLAETAQSRIGWLSDMQGLHPEASEDDPCDDTWVIFKDFYGRPFGSIDLHHIAEYAAKIAEGENK